MTSGLRITSFYIIKASIDAPEECHCSALFVWYFLPIVFNRHLWSLARTIKWHKQKHLQSHQINGHGVKWMQRAFILSKHVDNIRTVSASVGTADAFWQLTREVMLVTQCRRRNHYNMGYSLDNRTGRREVTSGAINRCGRARDRDRTDTGQLVRKFAIGLKKC